VSCELKPLSESAQKFPLGEYEHYKGGRYQILGVGRHSEDHKLELVAYQSLENGNIWFRPLPMFLENVEVNGRLVPRFKLVG
jgi:cyclomaltodextrinase / maltogenic alpha-amylase / neopullulanase